MGGIKHPLIKPDPASSTASAYQRQMDHYGGLIGKPPSSPSAGVGKRKDPPNVASGKPVVAAPSLANLVHQLSRKLLVGGRLAEEARVGWRSPEGAGIYPQSHEGLRAAAAQNKTAVTTTRNGGAGA